MGGVECNETGFPEGSSEAATEERSSAYAKKILELVWMGQRSERCCHESAETLTAGEILKAPDKAVLASLFVHSEIQKSSNTVVLLCGELSIFRDRTAGVHACFAASMTALMA